MSNAMEQRLGPADIRIDELVAALWSGRWLLLVTTAIFAAIGLALAFVLPKKYTATVIVSPVSEQGGGGRFGSLSPTASQFASIASVAGISLGASSQKAETIAVLQSELLTQRYIVDNDLLPELFWRDYDVTNKLWKVHGEDVPTLWKANVLFKKKVRSVEEDAKTGIVSVAITWRDPALAARWANDLVKLTNDYLREKAIAQSERNIAFLTRQASQTDLVSARQAISTIMETEINKAMLARGSEEYALKVIDPAMVPEKPASPKKPVWLVLGAMLGFSAGTAWLILCGPRMVRSSP